MKRSIRDSGEAVPDAGIPFAGNPDAPQSSAACRLPPVREGGNRVRRVFGNMQQFRMFPMKLFQWFLIFFCGNEAESCGGFGGFDLQGPGRVFLGLRANGDDKPVLGMDDGGIFKNERIGAVRQFPSVQKNAGITGVVDDHVAGTRFQPGDGLLNLEAFCQLGEGDFRNTPCALFRRMQPVNIPFRMVGERVQRIKETDFVLACYGGNQFFRFRTAEPLSEPAYLRTSG